MYCRSDRKRGWRWPASSGKCRGNSRKVPRPQRHRARGGAFVSTWTGNMEEGLGRSLAALSLRPLSTVFGYWLDPLWSLLALLCALMHPLWTLLCAHIHPLHALPTPPRALVPAHSAFRSSEQATVYAQAGALPLAQCAVDVDLLWRNDVGSGAISAPLVGYFLGLFEAQVAIATHRDYVELLDGDDGHPMPGTASRGFGRQRSQTCSDPVADFVADPVADSAPFPRRWTTAHVDEKTGWPYVQSEKRFLASPIRVDINEDGTEEILVISKNAELLYFTCVNASSPAHLFLLQKRRPNDPSMLLLLFFFVHAGLRARACSRVRCGSASCGSTATGTPGSTTRTPRPPSPCLTTAKATRCSTTRCRIAFLFLNGRMLIDQDPFGRDAVYCVVRMSRICTTGTTTTTPTTPMATYVRPSRRSCHQPALIRSSVAPFLRHRLSSRPRRHRNLCTSIPTCWRRRCWWTSTATACRSSSFR